MLRDFLLWRHLRVVRARTMRHLHQAASKAWRAAVPHAEPRTDIGHNLRFTADLSRARFFDPATGDGL
jgi:hypothetical protein